MEVDTKTDEDGHILLEPIPGDMVRTVESQPQVIVTVNNVPSACRGDCSFNWTEEATPTITSTTPSSGTTQTNCQKKYIIVCREIC